MLKYLPLLLLFISCVNKQENRIKDKAIINSVDTLYKNRIWGTSEDIMSVLEDSLLVLAKKETVVIDDDIYVRGFGVDGEQFAFIAYMGYAVNVYKLVDGFFAKVCTDKFDGGFLFKNVLEDLNFDGYKDLVVTTLQGAYGNIFPTVFIYDKVNKTYKRAKNFDLVNLEIDKKNKLLRSQLFTSVCGSPHKWVFKVQNDNIELLDVAFLTIKCNDQNFTTPIINIFNYKDNIVVDSFVKQTENAWELYHKALWDNSKDYEF